MTREEAEEIIAAKLEKKNKPQLSDEDRKAKQNAYYKQWREKLASDPVKLVEYWQRKNEASKKCYRNKKQNKEQQ